jgi:hypothetical protein
MSTTVKVGVSETSASQYAGPAKAGDGSTTEQTTVEAPFTEYRNVNKLPLTADYIDAKLTWDEAYMVDDVMKIEDYLTTLVNTGELENSVKSAKNKLKDLEKMAGIDKLESKAQKLIKLATFVEYLQKLEERTKNGWQD